MCLCWLNNQRCPTTLMYMPSQHDARFNWFGVSWKREGGKEGRREERWEWGRREGGEGEGWKELRGREEGCRLCDCATYNAFWDRCHGITKKRKCQRFSNANTSLGSKSESEETSTTIESVSLPLYFHKWNISTTITMTLVSTMTSAVLTHFEYNVMMS